MRVIMRYCSPWGNYVTHSIDVESDMDVSFLNDFIAEKFEIPKELQVLRFKHDGIQIKLVQGFPLNHYGVHDKSVIFVEKLEQQQEEEDDFTSRSLSVKGDYFAKLGLLSAVAEEEDDEENERYSRKPSLSQNSNVSKGFGGKSDSYNGSNKTSNTLPETLYTSDDELPSKKFEGELMKAKKSTIEREDRVRFIKEVKANNIERIKEFLNLYEVEQNPETKVKSLINENGDSGWNSVHWAAYLGHSNLVEVLVRYGGDLNSISEDGWTPLQLAVHRNYVEVVKVLLRDPGKVQIDQVTTRMTALHIAVKNARADLVALLLEKGASLKVKNEQGELPMDFATNEKVKRILDYVAKRRAIEEFSPPKPPIVRGYMYKRGNYLYKMNQRYFVLNAEEGTLIRYSKKEDYPNKPREIIPLKSIESVKRISSGQFADKNLSYIQLLYLRMHTLACNNEEIANQWVTFILQGAVYTSFLEQNLEKDMQTSLASGIGGEIASYFGRITEEIELDDLPPNQNGINTKSQAQPEKKESFLSRLTNSFSNSAKISSDAKKKEISSYKTVHHQTEEDNFPEEKVNFQSFQILKVLGSGAFGKVYKVMKKDNGKIYAMKALRKRNLILKNQLKYAVTEVNVLKMTDHPFILGLHYAFQTPLYLYMILDYCPNGDLSLHLANKGTFTENETRFFLAELVLAIEHLHSKNVIYRDLKPENILTTEDGHIKLADFGLAKEGVQDTDIARSFCGSPAYLSPEMLRNKGVGKAADIYGIGTVMHEMLIGQSPYFSEDVQQMYSNIKKGHLSLPSHLSDAAKDLLNKLLNKDPMQRPGMKNKNDLRNHPFFAGINWKKLEAREVTPPKLEPLDEDDIEMPINMQHPFKDADYAEENKLSNRVRNYTFVKKAK